MISKFPRWKPFLSCVTTKMEIMTYLDSLNSKLWYQYIIHCRGTNSNVLITMMPTLKLIKAIVVSYGNAEPMKLAKK